VNEIKKPSLEKKWLLCPFCGAKTILYDNTANCTGIFIKCTRGCKLEFEVKIQDGKVMH